MTEALLSVAGLHALVYCPRLFFLEEVERLRVADDRVYAGRRAHLEHLPSDEGKLERLTFESESLGIQGSLDLLRHRDGGLVVYEHKVGRATPEKGAWDSDRVQCGAYALLVEECLGREVNEARVRYHASQLTVRVPIDEALRAEVREAISRARELQRSTERPPITPHEKRCEKCSLAPVCLPEEARLAADPTHRPLRLLPPHPSGMVLHVTADGARVGREGWNLVVKHPDGTAEKFPTQEVDTVVVHGFAQITTQALRLCADKAIGVHWVTQGGGLVGSLAPSAASGQRHLRQFEALRDEGRCLSLAKSLVLAKLSAQLRFLMRATRGGERGAEFEVALTQLRRALSLSARAADIQSLRGQEGAGASAYFGALPLLASDQLDESLRPTTRSRRPAEDRFSALLNYGYGMLYREVLGAILAVGLHPSMGFFHQLRSSAHPLALDLMELFRVPMVDMPIMAALNRRTFVSATDFQVFPGKVVLSESGRAKLIEVIERRRYEQWKHDVVGYSLSYTRIVELEVRLLEKEWTGESGLFAKLRIR